MHKEHPVPNTPATKVSKVDGFITEFLKGSFPKSDDTDLTKVQSEGVWSNGMHVGRVD